MHDKAKFSNNHYYKVGSCLSESSIKFDFWRPLAKKLELRRYVVSGLTKKSVKIADNIYTVRDRVKVSIDN
jgi:hypothetical protein